MTHKEGMLTVSGACKHRCVPKGHSFLGNTTDLPQTQQIQVSFPFLIPFSLDLFGLCLTLGLTQLLIELY